jgi:hypothetical protein
VRAGRPTLLALALAACVAAASAHAEFQDDYALGLKAIDDGRLQEARRYLEKAVAAQPEPVDKVVLNGNNTQPYLPYHFLGFIAYRLGECDVAKAHWENPANRRMVGRLTQVRQQEQSLMDSCRPRRADAAKQEAAPAAATPPASAPPAAASASADAASEHVPPPRLVRAVDSYLAGRYVDATRIEPESFPAARTRFHAFLIRAAARFTLAQINGDKMLLAAARADAHSAQVLDAKAAPDEALYSPKFRTFYAQAR